MLPLIPLALSIAPEIGKWLFGGTGEKVTQAAVEAVKAVTGTDDPAGASAALAADPAAAAALRVQLAQIAASADADARRADLETLRAGLADTANARAQTVDLARIGSGVQWGAAVVSALVLSAFAGVVVVVLFRALPAGSETIANMLLGTLSAMAGGVVQFWTGSSAGSERKTGLLARAQPIS